MRYLGRLLGGHGLAVLAFVLELLLGFGGIYGGVALIGDPTGAWLGLPQAWLHATPFRDYAAPGWILLVCNGFLPLFAAAVIVFRPERAPWAVVATGAVLTGWMIGQVSWLGWQMWIQHACFAFGIGLVALGTAWWGVSRGRLGRAA